MTFKNIVLIITLIGMSLHFMLLYVSFEAVNDLQEGKGNGLLKTYEGVLTDYSCKNKKRRYANSSKLLVNLNSKSFSFTVSPEKCEDLAYLKSYIGNAIKITRAEALWYKNTVFVGFEDGRRVISPSRVQEEFKAIWKVFPKVLFAVFVFASVGLFINKRMKESKKRV